MNTKNALKNFALATAFVATASSIALPLAAQAETNECENFLRTKLHPMEPLQGVNAPKIESKIFEAIQPNEHRICYTWKNISSTTPTVTPSGENCITLDASKKGKDLTFTFAPKYQYAPIVITYGESLVELCL